ncbi:MAG: tetratricopeptide repeat protein [Actinobacteria bacterium]|nr:tetratricopeptide repeat protein [Actinomycetota bacterium]
MNHLDNGTEKFNKRKLSDVEAKYRRALEKDPQNAHALAKLADALENQEKYEEARKFCLQALDINDSLAEVHLILGRLGIRSKDFEAAESEFHIALELCPEDTLNYIGMGALLIERKKYREAIEFLRQARERYPESPEIAYNLGSAYLNLEEYDQAYKHLKSALDAVPTFAGAAFGLGMLHMKQKSYSGARGYLEKAVALEPECFQYQVALGMVEVQEGHTREARQRFREFADKSGRSLTRKQMARCFVTAPPLGLKARWLIPLVLISSVLALAIPIISPLTFAGAGALLIWVSFEWLWYGSKRIGAVLFAAGALLLSIPVLTILIFAIFVLSTPVWVKLLH